MKTVLLPLITLQLICSGCGTIRRAEERSAERHWMYANVAKEVRGEIEQPPEVFWCGYFERFRLNTSLLADDVESIIGYAIELRRRNHLPELDCGK